MAEQQDMGLQPPVIPDPTPAPKQPRGMGVAPLQTYIIYGTNQPYQGRVVEVGGQLYTTQGGALEGFSFQLMAPGGQNTPDVLDGETRRPRRLRNQGPGGLQQGTVRPNPRDPFGLALGDPNQMTPDIPEGKITDDPQTEEGLIDEILPIIPDDTMNQGGGSY